MLWHPLLHLRNPYPDVVLVWEMLSLYLRYSLTSMCFEDQRIIDPISELYLGVPFFTIVFR